MTQRPRALFVTPVAPATSGAGRFMRAWAWVTRLAETHDVHVLICDPAPRTGPDPACPAAASVRRLDVRQGPLWRRRLGLLWPPLVFLRGFANEWLWPADHQSLAPILADGSFDRVVVFRLYLHPIAMAIRRQDRSARLEMDLDDLESRARQSISAALLRLGRKRKALCEVAMAGQYALAERALLSSYHTLHLAAEEDVKRLPDTLQARAEIFPNRLAAPARGTADEPGRILFVGTLDYPPNEEAARFVITELAPCLADTKSPTVTVVGRDCPPALSALVARTAGAEILSNVADLSAIYAAARVVVVPLWAGGGTKFKTLEAFAHARPLVATREAVRGLDAVDGLHYLEAETPQDFARAIRRLLESPALADQVGQAGYRLWHDRFRLESTATR